MNRVLVFWSGRLESLPKYLRGLTENARHEIAGHEIAGHDKYRMKIDCITLECAFLLNFKSFVRKASVLTYKKLNCACSS